MSDSGHIPQSGVGYKGAVILSTSVDFLLKLHLSYHIFP